MRARARAGAAFDIKKVWLFEIFCLVIFQQKKQLFPSLDLTLPCGSKDC